MLLLARAETEAQFDALNELVCECAVQLFRSVSVASLRLCLKRVWQEARRPQMSAPDLLQWSRGRKWDCVVADPPWPNSTNWTLASHAFYPRMTVKQIAELPVAEVASEHAVVFLWSTSMFLEAGLRIIQQWGYRFCGYAFIWVKRNSKGNPAHGYGPTYYTAKCTELVLMGTRGPAPIAQEFVVDVLDTQRREHSRKPEEFWDALQRYLGQTYPRRLELFSREPRKGWKCWGNEVKF